jgi:hypothetical protein
MVKTAQRSPGFLRADRYRPLAVQEGGLKWYMVLHFEQPDRLRQWLKSSDSPSGRPWSIALDLFANND